MSNKTDGLILNAISKLNVDKIQRVSFFGISCWILMPIVIMFLNACGANGADVYLVWVYSLYLIGALGLFCCLCYCANNLDLKKENLKVQLKEKLPILLLLCFLMWSLISCLLSDNKKMAFFGAYPFINSWFTFLLYGGFIFDGLIVSKNKSYVKKIAVIFLIVSTIQAVISLMNNDITFKLNNSNFYVGFNPYQSVFYNTNHYAYYLLISLMVASFALIYAKSVKARLLYVSLIALFLSTLILNNTFGAYLSFIITFIILLIWWIANKRKGIKSLAIIATVFVLTSFMSTLYTGNVKNNFVSLFSDVDVIVEDEDTSSVGSNRGELWKNALVCIKNDPIFGCGLENIGSVPNYDDEEIAPSNPHNFVLFFAKHTGIPGLVLYLSSLFTCLYRAIKQRLTMSNTMEASVFVVLAYLISAFFGVAKFYTSPYYLVTLAIGMRECVTDK